MDSIVDIQLARLIDRLEARNIALRLDGLARAWLADAGYDQVYGARPLKRVIQRNLENPLATMLLDGTIGEGETVHIAAAAGSLTINGQVIEAEAA